MQEIPLGGAAHPRKCIRRGTYLLHLGSGAGSSTREGGGYQASVGAVMTGTSAYDQCAPLL